MTFIASVVAFFVALAIVAIIALILYEYFVARAEVALQPREEMFVCDKHGPLRASSLINFLDQKWCPLCFHEKQQGIALDSSVNLRAKDYN